MKNTKTEKIIGGIVAWSLFIIVISLVIRACNNDIKAEALVRAEHIKNVPHTHITNCYGIVFEIHTSEYAEVKSAMDRQKIEKEQYEERERKMHERAQGNSGVGDLVGAAVVTKMLGFW